MLLIVGLAVTNLRERWVASQHRPSEPHCVSLHHVLQHAHLNGLGFVPNHFLVSIKTCVDSLLHELVQLFVESIKEGASTGEHNILVEFPPVVHGA